jgi:hypothetical protein
MYSSNKKITSPNSKIEKGRSPQYRNIQSNATKQEGLKTKTLSNLKPMNPEQREGKSPAKH